MAYLIDANVFIQAKNLQYGFDFCPAFWEWLIAQNSTGNVFSIERVSDELAAGADHLSVWAQARGAGFFRKPAPTLVQGLGQVSTWAVAQDWEPAAQSNFFQVADYYLIADALAGGHTVVTHEIPANSKKRIKIPNVCIGLGIKFVSPYQMLRTERARFLLGSSTTGAAAP